MPSRINAHRRHAGQKGLTLIEVMVASAILAVLALPLGAAVSLGIRELGGNRLQGHLAAANDLLAIERQLGRDVGQADCVVAVVKGKQTSSCPTGPCNGIINGLCVASYDCHKAPDPAAWEVVSYALSNGQVIRKDSTGRSTIVARDITGFSPSLDTGNHIDVVMQTTVEGTSQQSDVRLLALPAQLGSQCLA